MDKIVALCKRRGFIFQSSEIYGGLASTYDYGHYGVLLKNNVKEEWRRAVVQERDDVVLLDAAILMHPKTWEASGHLAGLLRPAGRSAWATASAASATTTSSRRSRPRASRPTTSSARLRRRAVRAARVQPDVRDATWVRSRTRASTIYLRPETAQGIFVNFKNVMQFARKKLPFGHRADRQVVPQRDHARQLHLPHARVRADGDRVLRARPATPRPGTRSGSTRACSGTSTSASAPTTCACARTTPTSSRTTRPAPATSSTSSRWAGASSRASPTAATSTSRSTPSSAARSSSTWTRRPTRSTSRT